jgi:zinc protease
MIEIVNNELVVGARHRKLPCGLDVLVHRDNSLPQVAVSMTYRAGSSDEQLGQSGLAHLVEHLFKNSLHLAGRRHYEILKHAGVVETNASTGTDRTEYHQVLPSNQLALALWLESDRMGYFLPALTQERIEQQQAVVRSERRQRYENAPFSSERFEAAALLYPLGHPHRFLTIGLHEDIQAANWDRIAAFYQTYYPPANATLVIAGDVDDAQCDALVDQYFGSFPSSEKPIRGRCDLRPLLTDVATQVPDQFTKLTRLHWVWRGPTAHDDDARALDVLTAGWSQPGSGALWRALVYDQPMAQRVSAWSQPQRLCGEIHIAVDLKPASRPQDARDIIARIVDDAMNNGLPSAHIHRLLARREASALWSMQRVMRRVSRLQHWALQADPGATRDNQIAHAQQLALLTPGSICVAAKTWLAQPHVEIVTVPDSNGNTDVV